MKILHVLTQLPSLTGSGVYFTNLIDSMNKLGIENAAIYGTEERFDLKIEALIKKPVIYNSNQLPFHICGMSDEMPYDSTIYSQMTDRQIEMLLDEFRSKLVEMKEEFDPDIVITHHLFVVSNVVREVFDDRKVVGISHGTDMRQVKKHDRFIKYLSRIKDLDYILTVTDQEDEVITKTLGADTKKIINIGGGYNDKIFYPADYDYNKESIDIVYAGKITQSKGVFELCKALTILEKKHPNIKLFIVGNPDSGDCERLKESANHSENLVICNAINQEKLGNMLRTSDIFVLPSYFEALGLIAIEALACHKLVVTSEIEGLRELLSKELIESKVIEFTKLPRIYNVDQPVEEDIPAYVKRLADNIDKQIERLSQEMFTENISKEIEKLAWSNIGKKILQIIE